MTPFENLERIWWRIERLINSIFHNYHLKRYFILANKMVPRIRTFLNSLNLDYTITMVDASETDWTKVNIDIKVKADNYDDIMKLWELVSEIAYFGIKSKGEQVYIHVEPKK